MKVKNKVALCWSIFSRLSWIFQCFCSVVGRAACWGPAGKFILIYYKMCFSETCYTSSFKVRCVACYDFLCPEVRCSFCPGSTECGSAGLVQLCDDIWRFGDFKCQKKWLFILNPDTVAPLIHHRKRADVRVGVIDKDRPSLPDISWLVRRFGVTGSFWRVTANWSVFKPSYVYSIGGKWVWVMRDLCTAPPSHHELTASSKVHCSGTIYGGMNHISCGLKGIR